MKFLRLETLFFLLLTAPAAVAQSNLPQCPTETKQSSWNNCQGRLPLDDKGTYVGEFLDGKMNGQGTILWPDGNKYVGEFRDDKLNGQGTLTWANEDKYVGEFRGGKLDGQGTLTWANGKKYVGEFRDGAMSGQGTMFAVDGTARKVTSNPTPKGTSNPAPTDKNAVVVPTRPGDMSAAIAVVWLNFERADCPRVVRTQRFSDGTVKVNCSNGEDFRVDFSGPFAVFAGKPVAIRCSAARDTGIAC